MFHSDRQPVTKSVLYRADSRWIFIDSCCVLRLEYERDLTADTNACDVIEYRVIRKRRWNYPKIPNLFSSFPEIPQSNSSRVTTVAVNEASGTIKQPSRSPPPLDLMMLEQEACNFYSSWMPLICLLATSILSLAIATFLSMTPLYTFSYTIISSPTRNHNFSEICLETTNPYSLSFQSSTKTSLPTNVTYNHATSLPTNVTFNHPWWFSTCFIVTVSVLCWLVFVSSTESSVQGKYHTCNDC